VTFPVIRNVNSSEMTSVRGAKISNKQKKKTINRKCETSRIVGERCINVEKRSLLSSLENLPKLKKKSRLGKICYERKLKSATIIKS
jgi:hypothetical protein